MTSASALLDVRTELKTLAHPQRMAGARRFFKTGERVEGYGVAAPELRRIAQGLYRPAKLWSPKEREDFATALWACGTMEEGHIACYLWKRFAKTFGASEFRLFTDWLDAYVHNWAHCDGLSLWLLGGALANEPALAARLVPWTRSRNRWRRRAAAVALVYSARRGQLTNEIFATAKPLLPDAEDIVQKGVGWLLKETYPKRPAALMKFLLPLRDKTSRLVLRLAAEKMSAADRARLLS